MTVILGARAKQLDKGPKSLWSGLPSDAKVFNLELGGNLPASHEYLKTVQQIMFDLAGLPEGSLGRTQPISNTSAAALQVQFQPLVEATERKLPSFKKGLEQVNYLILRYYQLATGISFPVDLCKHCGGRIVEVQEDGVSKRQCFTIDPQTLQFLSPEDVQVSIKRKYSFGSETRKVPFSQALREHKKASSSFWDPEPEVDLQEKAEGDHDRAIAAEDWQTAAQGSYDQNERTLQEEARPKEVDEDGNSLSPEAQDQVADIPQPPEPMPPELEPPVEVEPEQLSPHDIDIPEEPVTIPVTIMTWDAQTQQFVRDNLGVKTLVPTGCTSPVYLNPYETTVEIKSALPRDRERDSNLYAQWQQNGWLDRHHIMKRLEIGENPIEVDKAIADDIPFLLAIQGKQDPTQQVAQTPGMQPNQPGDNHGAPLPPGPGPGRGNRFAPGDDLAQKPTVGGM